MHSRIPYWEMPGPRDRIDAESWESFLEKRHEDHGEMDHPKIRNDAKGHLLLNFGDYGEEVEVAAISGDGRRTLTVREVGVAQVWDVESGGLLAEIRPDSPLRGAKNAAPVGGRFEVFIESAALSRDGAFALLGLNDGTAAVYAVGEAARRSVLHPPDQAPGSQWGVIRSVAYSTGDLAVVGFSRRRVGVWSTDGARRIAFLDPASDRLVGRPFVRDTLVSSVGLSPDGRYVFAGAVDMTAAIFDLESGKVVFRATEHAEDIIAIVDAPYGVGWATTAGSFWIRGQSGEVERRLDTGEHWAEVVFDRGGEGLLARGFDDRITHWSFDGKRTLLFEPAGRDRGRWAAHVATLCLRGNLVHYPEGGRRVVVGRGDSKTVIERDARIVRVALTPQADAIATDGWKDEVEIWDAATGNPLRSFPCQGGSGCFAFSPDGARLAIGEIGHGGGLYPRHVYLYETATGRRQCKLSEHQWQVKAVAFSPDGRRLASLGDDLVLWDLDTIDKPLLCIRLDRTTSGIAFAGPELIAVESGLVRVFADARERLAFPAPIEFGTPWGVSNDGARLCVAGNQSVLRFSLDTGELKDHVAAEIPRPERLPTLAMAEAHGIRGGAMLWRTTYGQFIHQSDGPRGWVQPLELSRGRVAIPCSSGAAVIAVNEDAAAFHGFVPFEGKLRAGRIVDGQSLMVNEKGQLYRALFNRLNGATSD